MKKIIKIAVFTIISILPLLMLVWYTYSKTFYFMDSEYPYWKQNEDFIRSPSKGDYDIVSLGDSACNGIFVPQIVGERFYNLALGGATPVEMYYMMETYLEYHQAPKIAFITFRNFHLSKQDCFWTRTMYFNYLSTRQEIDFFKTAYNMDKSGYSMDNWFTDWMQYNFRWPTKYMPAIKNAFFHKRKKTNDSGYRICVENRGKYIGIGSFLDSSANLASDCWFDDFKICAINEFYLHKLIGLLLENNVAVIVEQLPFNETSFKAISDKVKQDEKDFFEDLQKKFPSVVVNSEAFCYDDFCFLDNHHLNYRGAAKYTHYICEKYADLLGEYRTDRNARYEEMLGYIRTIKNENGLLETLDDDIFSLRIFVKDRNKLESNCIQTEILSKMNNFVFADSFWDFEDPVEFGNLVIEAKKGQ